MTLTTHAAIGAGIGTVVGNPLLGFALGAASHFLVDMIPHGDNQLSDRFRVEKKRKLPVAYVLVDGICAIILIMILINIRPEGAANLPFAAAIIGSVLPDLLVGLSDVMQRNQLLQKYSKFHFFFHDFFSRRYGDTKLTYALIGQLGFIALIVYWL